MNIKRVALLGDNCVDIYTEPKAWYLTGNIVDTAVNLARLGRPVSILTTTADDYFGRLMHKFFSDEGMDISHVHEKHGETAITEMQLIDGERIHGEYYEGVLGDMKFDEEDIRFAGTHALVHSAFWGNAEAALKAIKENHPETLISYDYADRPFSERVEELATVVDIGFFSWKEQKADELDSFIQKRLDQGMKCVVITFGEQGSMAADANGVVTYGIEPAEVVNTVGAGDSFIAGFIHAYLNGLEMKECLKSGAQVAAKVVATFDPY